MCVSTNTKLSFNIKNFTILGMSANDENLKVLESLHIHLKKKLLYTTCKVPIPFKQLDYDFLF